MFLPIKSYKMTYEKLAGEDLITLQKEKGNICISVIVPTHRLFPERKADRIVIDKAVENTILLLEAKYGQKETKELSQKLKDVIPTIDYDHNLDGIGFFVSENVSSVVKFPFPVKEKIVVDRGFEIRDLLYKTNISKPYYTLLLSEKKIRLFQGVHEDFTEIRGKHFPFEFYDDWEYNPPSRVSSEPGNAQIRSFEHDKSTMQAVRFQDFFRKADEYLSDYLVQKTPLIVTGTDKEIFWFEKVTAFSNHIVGKISGSFDHYNTSEIGKKCWPVFENYLTSETEKMILKFREMVGQGLGVTGIQDIWTAVMEGKGWTLIVEKDFKVPGFTTAGNEHFVTLRPPKENHETIADAVDVILETILAKGGDVLFAENGKLNEFGGMVLITRY